MTDKLDTTDAPDATDTPTARPGHGDHWLAALSEDDPRLREALEVPVDAPDRLTLHRTHLTRALDRVQVTHQRRLVTSYPEPRATTLVEGRPRELALWETRVEGWLVLEHPTVGALTLFVSDLAEHANRYAAHAAGTMRLEVGALAYLVEPVRAPTAPNHMAPGSRTDARFLADDYSFEGDVVAIDRAADETVLDVALQGDLVLPVTTRHAQTVDVGDRVSGFFWLTGRWPA